jgi:hypothetical protein
MHVVALTRWNAALALEQELPVLAPALALGLYDARLKLAVPPPAVLATLPTLEQAQQLLALLRRRGHGAVACAMEAVPAPERAISCRGFTLESDAFAGIDGQRRPFTLPYREILGVVRAFELSSETQMHEKSEKKFAIGRALLSGGVMMKKTVTKTETSGSTERQHVAYMFQSRSPEPVVLEENGLSYEGLGPARTSTARGSFEALIKALRRCAPTALHDDRLVTHKRRVDLTSVRGLTKDRTFNSSNAPANALAAYLLMLGHLQNQL